MEKQFKRAYIEITNICNLSCSFCPIEERERQVMSVDSFEHALREVAPLCEEISLHLMGEPLAHPQLEEIFQKCSQQNMPVVLTTNGLLVKKFSNLLLATKCLKQVNISIQSYLDNNPTKPLGDYLDLVTDFIDQAVLLRSDLYINLRLWNLNESKPIGDNNIQAQNEKVMLYLEQKYQLQIKREVDVGGIKSKKLFQRVYLNFDSRFEWPRLDLPNNGTQGKCYGLINQIGIHADGTVVPCCLDDQKILELGNIFEESGSRILGSERAKAIREGFLRGELVEELCQKCDFITRFSKKTN